MFDKIGFDFSSLGKMILKHKNIIDLVVASIIFWLLVIFSDFISTFDFFHVISALLSYIVILETIRMISDYTITQKIHLKNLLDTFIIFCLREIILLYSNRDMEFIDKTSNIILGLIIIGTLFYFRFKTIKINKLETENKKSTT